MSGRGPESESDEQPPALSVVSRRPKSAPVSGPKLVLRSVPADATATRPVTGTPTATGTAPGQDTVGAGESEEDKRKLANQKLLEEKRKQRLTELQALFAGLFPQPEWHHHPLKGEKLVFTKEGGSKITIEIKDEEVSFSGKPVEKVIEAANAYQEYQAKAGIEVVYEVDAKSPEAAKAFMLKLQQSGFDVAKITAVNCANGEAVDLPKLLAEIKATAPVIEPAKPSSSPISSRG